MKCPTCGKPAGGGEQGIRVIDSRPCPGGIRRRRECQCGTRFSTIETIVYEAGGGVPVTNRTATRRFHKTGPGKHWVEVLQNWPE